MIKNELRELVKMRL